MAINKKWKSSLGLWLDADDDSLLTNDNASEKAKNSNQILDAYMKYLGNAEQQDGTFDFTDWNAKKLVWELGNKKSLPAIRSVIYKFQNLTGQNLVTLGSGPRISISKAQAEAAAKQKFDDRGWSRFVKPPEEEKTEN